MRRRTVRGMLVLFAGIFTAGGLGEAGVLPRAGVIALAALACVGFVLVVRPTRWPADAATADAAPADAVPSHRPRRPPPYVPLWVSVLVAVPQLLMAGGLAYVLAVVDEPFVYAGATPALLAFLLGALGRPVLAVLARRTGSGSV